MTAIVILVSLWLDLPAWDRIGSGSSSSVAVCSIPHRVRQSSRGRNFARQGPLQTHLMRFGLGIRYSNARKRGLPFVVAMALFGGPTIEFDDSRRDYGERRIIAYGAVAGRI